jgi:hypothetical protein
MGSKGSKVKIDTVPLANAAQYAADVGERLGTDQLNEARRQYDNDMRVATPIIEAQTGLMRQSIEQGDDYYDYMKGTFRPIEQELADEAATGRSRYDTNVDVRANIEREASRAGADVQSALAGAQAQSARAMSSMGVNPNSGRFASMKVGEGLQAAAMRAGAQTGARDKGVQLDYAKRMDVTGLARGLPGASQGAYSVALNSGNSAVGNQLQTGQKMLNGMQAGNGTIMQGQGMNLQGLGQATSLQANAAIANAQADAQASAGLMSGLGMIAGATIMKPSDIRLKENIVAVGKYENGLVKYEFNYIGDDVRYRGVMAQDVMQTFPDAVHEGEDGMLSVDYAMLGIEMERV